jgi:hypothetical protein
MKDQITMWQRADGDDCVSLARYLHLVQDPNYTYLENGIDATVGEYHGSKKPRFMADCCFDMRDERGQWRVCELFDTPDGAAKEAADFVQEAERCMANGETHPGRKREAAAHAHLLENAEYVAAADEAAAARFAMTRAEDAPVLDYSFAQRRLALARDRLADMKPRLIDAFNAAHNWREFSATCRG